MDRALTMLMLYLLPVLIIMAARSSKKKKNGQDGHQAGAPRADTAAARPSAPHVNASVPRASAPLMETQEIRQFESLENMAWANEPQNSQERSAILDAAGEGEDPCHADMFHNVHDVQHETVFKPHATEWIHAVVMSEVLKRPCERRGYSHRTGGYAK